MGRKRLDPCEACKPFFPSYEDLTDPYDKEDKPLFPDEIENLKKIKGLKYHSHPGNIHQCVQCNQYFRITESTPGGSEDAQRSWIRTSIYPISVKEYEKCVLEMKRRKENPPPEYDDYEDELGWM